MIKFSFLTSFLIILAMPPPANSFQHETIVINPRITNLPETPAVVIATDAIIHNICSQTGNPETCRHTLSQFEGKPLFPKPLGNVTEMAKKHAKKTAKKIYALYDAIKDKKSAVKMRYNMCLKQYANAMNLLNKADKSLNRGEASKVKMYSSNAVNEVYDCDQELHRKPYEPSNLSEENKVFRDIVSIIYVICSIVSPGK
ncbi:hypothetical protein DH2020_046667 [Rehmannia glutinosa]|uniref:Pectinesterase inhibitor domain-containing protein n=1 Tax=Rehmannia glutinosa TaxID=99300 RepID=A0ABR0UAK9_REHGL